MHVRQFRAANQKGKYENGNISVDPPKDEEH